MLAAQLFTCLMTLFMVPITTSVPVNNGLDGDPEVECADSYVGINFRTIRPFEGRIFVKDKIADPDCRVGATNRTESAIQLSFTSCGLQRTRSKQPPGIFIGVTVIISFHPQFITKIDKAYMIQCFYMESWKDVTAELEISMLTTEFQSQTVPMPICRYEVLSSGPTGLPVLFAYIGDQVYHKWTCDAPAGGAFCMIVHSCIVDDGAGDQILLIDETGCALDRHILGNLEYISDLMVGKEAHVFKYADRSNLYFDCQITVTVKDPNQPCPKPICPELSRSKRSFNGKKEMSVVDESPASTVVEVESNSIKLLDVLTKTKDKFNGAMSFELLSFPGFLENNTDETDICLSVAGFSVFGAFNALLMLSSFLLCVASFRKNLSSKHLLPNSTL